MKDKKYYSLYKQIKKDILSGKYVAGSKLPSKRVMASNKGCSVITVENAYGMLFEEGYVESKERSGYFVKELDGFIVERDSLKNSLTMIEEKTISPKDDFEYSVWVKTLRRVISEKGKKLFVKSPMEGVPALRNALSEYLLKSRDMVVPPERIIIGSGAEQLYENVVKLLGRDKIFGTENPCYNGILEVYNGEGVKTIPLKMGKCGIEKEELLNKPFDVLHVTPFNSYPSNITATAGKRFEYLSWARKNEKYIVEDDFAGEFYMAGNPIDSLYAMDGGKHVIYINTFSKSLSPSMRMGYMILPEKLMPDYERKLGKFSCSVPVLEQYVLAEFISSGSFVRHLNKVRRKLKTAKNENKS